MYRYAMYKQGYTQVMITSKCSIIRPKYSLCWCPLHAGNERIGGKRILERNARIKSKLSEMTSEKAWHK